VGGGLPRLRPGKCADRSGGFGALQAEVGRAAASRLPVLLPSGPTARPAHQSRLAPAAIDAAWPGRLAARPTGRDRVDRVHGDPLPVSVIRWRHATRDDLGMATMATASIPQTQHDPGRLRVDLVDPTADPRWAAFVATHPDGLAFHHPAWIATLADTFGYPPAHLACEDDQGRLHGVLPLVYRRGLIRGRQLWSLPCTAVAGPLTTSAAATNALIQTAIKLAQEPPAHQLILHSMVPDIDPGGTVLTRVEGSPTYV